MVSFLFLYDIRFGQKMDLTILHPGFLEVFGRYQSHSSTDFSAFWYISSLDIRVQKRKDKSDKRVYYRHDT